MFWCSNILIYTFYPLWAVYSYLMLYIYSRPVDCRDHMYNTCTCMYDHIIIPNIQNLNRTVVQRSCSLKRTLELSMIMTQFCWSPPNNMIAQLISMILTELKVVLEWLIYGCALVGAHTQWITLVQVHYLTTSVWIYTKASPNKASREVAMFWCKICLIAFSLMPAPRKSST